VTETGLGLLARLTEGLQREIEAVIERDSDPATLDGLVEGMRRVAAFADRIGDSHVGNTGDEQPPP
jgi:hypothetical protein